MKKAYARTFKEKKNKYRTGVLNAQIEQNL